jgi:hypothetical protein
MATTTAGDRTLYAAEVPATMFSVRSVTTFDPDGHQIKRLGLPPRS